MIEETFMSVCADLESRMRVRGRHGLRAALAATAMLASAQASAAGDASANSAVPDFASASHGWLLAMRGTDFIPPASGVASVTNDPAYPHVGNNQGAQPTERIADLTNPNLKPWVVAMMEKSNNAILKDHKVGFVAQSRCWPGGVPGQLLFPAEPVFFVQTPREVW